MNFVYADRHEKVGQVAHMICVRNQPWPANAISRGDTFLMATRRAFRVIDTRTGFGVVARSNPNMGKMKLSFSIFDMKITALIPLALIAGCAATGTTFTPATDLSDSTAIIYVYRPDRAANSGGYPLITLDSEVKGPLKNAGYLAIRVPAGTHVVEQQYSVWNWNMRAKPVVIKAEPKQRYFIKLDSDVSSALALPTGSYTTISINRSLYFGQVDDRTGMTEIRDLKLSQ